LSPNSQGELDVTSYLAGNERIHISDSHSEAKADDNYEDNYDFYNQPIDLSIKTTTTN